MNTLGLYIHIPFCKSKCRYCDFLSFPCPKPDSVQSYLSALTREIEEQGARMTEYYGAPPTVDSIFFGGGTPTFLAAHDFCMLMEALLRAFCVAPSAEITAECNPATADADYLRAIRAVGVNRLSIGAQSMNDGELKLLGRLHRAKHVVRTFADARAAGFENISADIMFGIPSGTRESLRDTLRAITSLSPEHLSVYGLQIEEGTYFARHRAELILPDEDTERQMYDDTAEFLAAHGLYRYEISNFARPGYRCAHNLKYWNREDYLGLGLAAHSCLGTTRFSNTESLSDYLLGQRTGTHEAVSDHDILCEKIMLGMRLSDGVDFTRLEDQHGPSVAGYRDALRRYVPSGFITANGNSLAFTDRGMSVSNAILADVLDFDA